MNSILLANVIYVFHVCIILFMLIVPFTNIIAFLVLHVTFGICLLIHWKFNSNVCALSIMESHFRGIDRVDTLTHKLISPVYEIPEGFWCHICTILTIILIYVSFTKILKSDKFKQTIIECKQIYSSKELDMFDKFIDYYKCIAYNLLST